MFGPREFPQTQKGNEKWMKRTEPGMAQSSREFRARRRKPNNIFSTL